MSTQHERAIAVAVRTVFRQQRQAGAARGFQRLADALAGPITAAYLAGAKGAKASPALAEKLVAAAKQRALESAILINETSREWLEGDRDPWMLDRVASIALTEASNARNQSLTLAAQGRRAMVRWVLDGKPCKLCKRIGAGKTLRAGSIFGRNHDGEAIRHPPVHPNCHCKLEEVR